jgi:dienelactone hydrolase
MKDLVLLCWISVVSLVSLVGCGGPLPVQGPGAVGTSTWVVTHPAGIDDPVPPESGPRRVSVQAWYPAQGEAGQIKEGAAFQSPDAPVLFFVHGSLSTREAHTSLGQELASRGFVVIAANHAGIARESLLPGDQDRGVHEAWEETLSSGDILLAANTDVYRRGVAVTRADVRLIMEQAPRHLPGLEMRELAFGGHSFGAQVATELCRQEPRCEALVNLDGPLLNDQSGVDARGRAILSPRGVDAPTLIVSTGKITSQPGAALAWASLDAFAPQVKGEVTHLHMAQAGHMDVTDFPLVFGSWLGGVMMGETSVSGVDPERSVGAANLAIRLFLEQQLQSGAVHPRGALDVYPELLVLKHHHP